MNSESIATMPAQERIDAVEVQERMSRPSDPAAAYCDTWLMINAGALNFKASEEHQVAAMANIGHQLLQEIAAYRPRFQWTNSPAEIVGAMVEEAANQSLATVQPVAVPDGPSAEDYSDMLRALFFHYAAGGYNDEGGLVPLETAKDKLEWIVSEAIQHAAPAAQGDAKDAERYQELRDCDKTGELLHFMLRHGNAPADTIDRMIDTAIAARKDCA